MSFHNPTSFLKTVGIVIVAMLLSHCSNRRVDVDKDIRDPANQNGSLIQVVPMVPAAVYALINEADSQLSEGQVKQAILTLKRALSISPASALVQQHLSEAYLSDADYKQALYWATLVVNQGPDQGALCERSRRTQALAAELLNEVAVQARALDAIAECTTKRPARF